MGSASILDQSTSVILQKYPSQNQKPLNFNITEGKFFHTLPMSWDRELNIFIRPFLSDFLKMWLSSEAHLEVNQTQDIAA